MMTEAQAVQKLLTLVDAGTDPSLTDDELTDCLVTHQRATLWTAGTAFSVGDRVISPITGRIYQCVYGGTSGGATPFTASYGGFGYYANCAIVDGVAGGLYWQDSGQMPREIYDIRGAANEAWTRKAAKAASLINMQDKDVKIDYAGLQKQCLLMAAQYRPVFAV